MLLLLFFLFHLLFLLLRLCLPYIHCYFLFSSIMSVPKPVLLQSPAFRDPPLIKSFVYLREYASYLHASHSTDIPASNRALTVHDLHKLLCDTKDGSWVNCPLHRGGRGMSVSRYISSELDCPFACYYEKVEYEHLSTLMQSFSGQTLP